MPQHWSSFDTPSQYLQASTVPITALYYLNWVLSATYGISRLSIAPPHQSSESHTFTVQLSYEPHSLLGKLPFTAFWVQTDKILLFLFSLHPPWEVSQVQVTSPANLSNPTDHVTMFHTASSPSYLPPIAIPNQFPTSSKLSTNEYSESTSLQVLKLKHNVTSLNRSARSIRWRSTTTPYTLLTFK